MRTTRFGNGAEKVRKITVIEPERVDFVAALRRVGVILVFLRGIPHESDSNVRYANGVGDSQAR